MPVTIKTIALFYNKESGIPPPLPCMLTDQLELFGRIPTSTSLLADEVLPPMQLMGAGTLPSKNRGTLSTARIPSPSPYPHKSPKSCTTSRAPTVSDDGSTDSTSDMESTTSTLSELTEDFKIPKPPGELGRLGRGGYTLETALGWNVKTYSKFKVCIIIHYGIVVRLMSV